MVLFLGWCWSSKQQWELAMGCWMWCKILHPVKKGIKFDVNDFYMKKYIPVLKDLPDKYLFKPWTFWKIQGLPETQELNFMTKKNAHRNIYLLNNLNKYDAIILTTTQEWFNRKFFSFLILFNYEYRMWNIVHHIKSRWIKYKSKQNISALISYIKIPNKV